MVSWSSIILRCILLLYRTSASIFSFSEVICSPVYIGDSHLIILYWSLSYLFFYFLTSLYSHCMMQQWGSVLKTIKQMLLDAAFVLRILLWTTIEHCLSCKFSSFLHLLALRQCLNFFCMSCLLTIYLEKYPLCALSFCFFFFLVQAVSSIS